MTKDEVIQLAMQEGAYLTQSYVKFDVHAGSIERFANLIEAAVIKRLSAGAGEPFIGVQYNEGWRSWQQVVPSAIGEEGVVACYTAEQVAAAVAAERLACAEMCESLFDADDKSCDEAQQCAAAIRGRTT